MHSSHGHRRQICIAFSKGGHREEMLQIIDAFRKHPLFYVTIKKSTNDDLPGKWYYLLENSHKVILFLINNFISCIMALRIVLLERPFMIVTNGAELAFIPMCYFAKLLGTRIVFIESYCRVTVKSNSGRLIYPISDLFLVQWEELAKVYGYKAKCWGSVF